MNCPSCSKWPHGRTPGGCPYNVHVVPGLVVGGRRWDVRWWVASWHTRFAVYDAWTGAYLCSGRAPLKRGRGLLGVSWEEFIVGFIEKSRPSKDALNRFTPASDPWLKKDCPAVHEYMTVGVLESGEVRQPSSLTLFCEGGLWKACLSEKDLDMVIFASGSTVEACLANLEERLTAPHPDWRRKGGNGGRKAPGRS